MRGQMEMSNCWFLSLVILLETLLLSQTSQASFGNQDEWKTATFLSPKFELEPGSVANQYLYGLNFPKGHIAVKRFDAEVVDEAGKSVPLYETYLHHWIVVRYYVRKGVDRAHLGLNQSDFIYVRNSGVCGGETLVQYFGLGAETRKTNTLVPNPYGIEVGNPKDIPEGYEEGWKLNIHAIDIRGTGGNRLGCMECRCDLYNVTTVKKGYIGGLECCPDGARCKVEKGFKGVKRALYLKFTVKYLEWTSSIIPVKIYIFDVTDTWNMSNKPTEGHTCKIEYDVDSCPAHVDKHKCIYTKSAIATLPSGGDVIYCVGHQHIGALGSTLYGEGGRKICSSFPIIGKGRKPGNEEGYVVGMTATYPRPGSLKIAKGEKLTVASSYNSSITHTGVMGVFYILVAEPLHKSNATLE